MSECTLALGLLDTRFWKHLVHVFYWDGLFVLLRGGSELIGSWGESLVFLLIWIRLVVPELFHCVFEPFYLFSQPLFRVLSHILQIFLLLLNWVLQHRHFLPILIHTLIKAFFLNVSDNRRNVRLDILPHVLYFLNILIQIVNLNISDLEVFLFLLH